MNYSKYKEIKSTDLVTSPSFTRGVVRSVNIFRKINKYSYSRTEQEADAEALYTDWKNTGNDLFEAVKRYEYIRTTIPAR